MHSPLRLNSELVAAAEREGLVQKRSIPKQIEFWAELGRAVERLIDLKDIFAVIQGLKQIRIEPAESMAVNPDEVFNNLETGRQKGELAEKVTSAAVYYEASRTRPGLLDQVNSTTGERRSGQFQSGKFKMQGPLH